MFLSKPSRSIKRLGLGLAAAAAGTSLAVTGPAGVAAASTRATWSTDWANSSFCAGFGAGYLGTTFNGVASCGTAYGTDSNEQGRISYNGVTLDSVGFQCVELAARYFYYLTGKTPPSGNGSDYAWDIHNAYPQYPVAPGGATGGTSTFSRTIVPGTIISLWSTEDETPGHVAVVTSVDVDSSGNGSISVIEENASRTGSDDITVTNNSMYFSDGGFNIFQWVYGLPGSSTVSPPPPPKSYPYNLRSNFTGTLHERTGPGTSYAVVGNLDPGAAINIVCQTTGSDVNGSDIWDKLTNDSYVSDDFTTTPVYDGWSPPIPHPC